METKQYETLIEVDCLEEALFRLESQDKTVQTANMQVWFSESFPEIKLFSLTDILDFLICEGTIEDCSEMGCCGGSSGCCCCCSVIIFGMTGGNCCNPFMDCFIDQCLCGGC